MSAAGVRVAPFEIRLFLESLFAQKPADLYVLLWTLSDKKSHWFEDLEKAIHFAESAGQRDLYVGVGLSGQNYGPTHRCVSGDVAGIVGLWADLDLKSAAHAKAALPATIEEALSILPEEFPPSFVVQTGNGAHAWWLFQAPLIFDAEDAHKDAASLVSRWQTLLRVNAANKGWAFDRLSDLARVLRIPGTQNCKDPQHPKPVSIYSRTDQRYDPSDFEEVLEDQSVPDHHQQERTTYAWQKKLAGRTLSINPNATVPEDLLNRHLTTDSRFKRTWERQREDLEDQSQSGYDLALANFGLDAGLSEQQVIDLMIHHRRIHGKPQRTRLDYFERTLSKAHKRSGNPLSSKSLGVDESSGEPPHAEPNSPGARAIKCDQISRVLGVRVLRIVKVTGKEPTYQMELDAAKVEFPSVAKLVEQKSLRLAIASAVDRLIPNFKPNVWSQIAQAMLDALTIEDGGEETDFVGAARIHLDNYLFDASFIESVEDQPLQTRRKPAIIDGQIAISSGDFQLYLNKNSGESYPIKAVASMLKAIGASTRRVKENRFRDQSRWLLPLSEFLPANYAGGDEEKSDEDPSRD